MTCAGHVPDCAIRLAVSSNRSNFSSDTFQLKPQSGTWAVSSASKMPSTMPSGWIQAIREPEVIYYRTADLRVAILFSECIGDLSRAGVRVQRPGNRNLARENTA